VKKRAWRTGKHFAAVPLGEAAPVGQKVGLHFRFPLVHWLRILNSLPAALEVGRRIGPFPPAGLLAGNLSLESVLQLEPVFLR